MDETTVKLNKDGTPDKRFGKKPDRKKRGPRPVSDMGKNRIPSARELAAMNPPPVEEKPVQEKIIEKVEQPKQEVTLSSEQKALADRLASGEDREWETITEESMHDFSLAAEPYPLPPEAKKMQDEKVYAFRFVEANAQRVDEVKNQLVPMRWYTVTRNSIPELAKYCDSIHGGLQVRDQVLMFKPWWMHRKFKDAEMGMGEAKVIAGAVENKDGEEHEWGEYRSGPDHGIETGRDEVMAEYSGDEAA